MITNIIEGLSRASRTFVLLPRFELVVCLELTVKIDYLGS